MTKNMKTRISLKYDTFSNWQNSGLKLRPGEIALAYIREEDENIPEGIYAGSVLYKCGMGDPSDSTTWKLFSNLPWGSALAADIHNWAKQDKIDVQKAGTGNVVASIAWDTSANGGKGGLKYETASVATSEGFEELQNALNALTENVYTKDDIDGMLENLSVHDTTYTDNKIAALSAEGGAIKAVADGLAELKGKVEDEDGALARANAAYELADAAQSKAYEVSETLDKFLDGITPDGSEAIKDTLKEISDYINEDTEAFTLLSGRVSTLEAKPGLDKVGTVTKVTAGEGLDGGDITAEGTISLNAATKASLAKADAATEAITDINYTLEHMLYDNAGDPEYPDWQLISVQSAIAAEYATQAACDTNGNDIIDTYATKEEIKAKADDKDLRDYMYSLEMGETLVNRAHSDENYNVIHETYATKEEVAALTTDDIAAGTEVWLFDCGNASTKLNEFPQA